MKSDALTASTTSPPLLSSTATSNTSNVQNPTFNATNNTQDSWKMDQPSLGSLLIDSLRYSSLQLAGEANQAPPVAPGRMDDLMDQVEQALRFVNMPEELVEDDLEAPEMGTNNEEEQ